jgi:hypothetical protein
MKMAILRPPETVELLPMPEHRPKTSMQGTKLKPRLVLTFSQCPIRQGVRESCFIFNRILWIFSTIQRT